MDLGCSRSCWRMRGLGEPCEQSQEGLSGDPPTCPRQSCSTFQTRTTPQLTDRCWNLSVSTASAQELGAQTAAAATPAGTAGPLRVARGLGPQHGAAVFSVPQLPQKGELAG